MNAYIINILTLQIVLNTLHKFKFVFKYIISQKRSRPLILEISFLFFFHKRYLHFLFKTVTNIVNLFLLTKRIHLFKKKHYLINSIQKIYKEFQNSYDDIFGTWYSCLLGSLLNAIVRVSFLFSTLPAVKCLISIRMLHSKEIMKSQNSEII